MFSLLLKSDDFFFHLVFRKSSYEASPGCKSAKRTRKISLVWAGSDSWLKSLLRHQQATVDENTHKWTLKIAAETL